MAFYTTLFGHVELPEPDDGRVPSRPSGVRTVRRPAARRGGRR